MMVPQRRPVQVVVAVVDRATRVVVRAVPSAVRDVLPVSLLADWQGRSSVVPLGSW